MTFSFSLIINVLFSKFGGSNLNNYGTYYPMGIPMQTGRPITSTSPLSSSTTSTTPTSTPTSTQTSSTAEPVCGISGNPQVESKIVGGNVTQVSSYPWYVALANRENGRYQVSCGATLISSIHVLTAAHCYDSSPDGLTTPDNRVRYLIIFDLNNRCRDEGKISRVRHVFIHEQYGKGRGVLPENDIALIVLLQAVLNMPICLPTKASYDNYEAIIVGYGSVMARSTENYPCALLEAKIKVLSKDECRRSGMGDSLAPNTICAGRQQGYVDACDGDSGGPLMVKEQQKVEIIGIVSYGEGCGRINKPGVYTDVTSQGFLSWIKQKQNESQSLQNQESRPVPINQGNYRPPRLPMFFEPPNIFSFVQMLLGRPLRFV